jgi:hypothetical protein
LKWKIKLNAIVSLDSVEWKSTAHLYIYVMCVVHAGFISSAYCAWYRGKEAKMKKKKKWKNESFKSNIPNGNLIRANGPDAILYSIYIRTYVDIPIYIR